MTEIKYIGKCMLIKTEKKKILVIGDLHLGYEGGLGVGGVRVGDNVFNELIEYLDKVLEEIGKVGDMVLLGDVKQDFGEITKHERENIIKFVNWANERVDQISIVKGNHDMVLEPILRGKGKVKLMDSLVLEDILFIHGDKKIEEIEKKEIKKVVMGHWHPTIEINEEEGVKSERYKCFLYGKQKGKEWIIVPSFSEQRYGKDIRETNFNEKFELNSEKFEVEIVQEEELETLNFGKLGKIRD